MTGKASWSQSKWHKGTGYLSRFSLSPLVSRFHFISFHFGNISLYLILLLFYCSLSSLGLRKKKKKRCEVFSAYLNFYFIFFCQKGPITKDNVWSRAATHKFASFSGAFFALKMAVLLIGACISFTF